MCKLHYDQCPKHENFELGDLSVKNIRGQLIACLSPCKRWNYPKPFGLGHNENDGLGKEFCCPPPVTVEECRHGDIFNTIYHQYIRYKCPSAYSYAYDDRRGLHRCPSSTSYRLTFFSSNIF